MCMITSTVTAGTLAAIGASTMAASTTAVAATTIAANAIIGAGLSAGISAATGARGRDLWTAAAIGGASAGVLSGVGMAYSGVSTAAQAANAANPVGSAGSGGGGMLAANSTTSLGDQTMTYGMMTAQVGMGAAEGVFGYMEAKDEASALKDQANMNKIRAGQVQDAAALEKIEQHRRTRQFAASQRTASAANGVMLETRAESSPAMFEQDTAAELAWDNAKTDYNANLEAWGYMEQARQQFKQAKATRRAGNLKIASGLIKGAVSAAGTYYMSSMGNSTTTTKTVK